MIEQAIKLFNDKKRIINALNYAMYIIGWDTETEAPVECLENRSEQIGVIYEQLMNIMFDEEYIKTINYLFDNVDELEPTLAKEIKEIKKDLDNTLKIPKEEQVTMSVVFASSANIWAEAKNNNNFNHFAPTLKTIVDYTKRTTKYLATKERQGYNTLLDNYEDGITVVDYDKFFNALKTELVPFVKAITAKKLNFNHDFLTKTYHKEGQKKFAEYLLEVMCFDKSFAVLKESEHPFTSGFGSKEIRITTHYYEDMILSSIYSVIHEAGHGTYERNVDPKLDNTVLSGGTSMAFHESQSRFYENIIGRSYAFWETHFAKLKEIFPEELNDVTIEDFYKASNEVMMSYIRTEADELTYPLHIMLRYDLEKELIDGDLEVESLPKRWNELFKQYFGLDVPTDTLGVLQDVHWSGGSFGYFPTYALGSAYAAQLYHQMKKELDVEKIIKSGSLAEIHNWLKEKVHKYGGLKTSKEILLNATNEEFNPQYYIDYLKEKYSKIYN